MGSRRTPAGRAHTPTKTTVSDGEDWRLRARCWPHPLRLPRFFVHFQLCRRSNVASTFSRGLKANILAGGSKQRSNSPVASQGLSPSSCRSYRQTSNLTHFLTESNITESTRLLGGERGGTHRLDLLVNRVANTSSCVVDAVGLLVFSEQENLSSLIEEKRTTWRVPEKPPPLLRVCRAFQTTSVGSFLFGYVGNISPGKSDLLSS